MKDKTDMPAYQLLDCDGEWLMYHISSQRFFGIDGVTHAFLDLCRSHSVDEARQELFGQGQYDPLQVESAAREVELLSQQGLFDVRDYSISEEMFESQLQRRYSSPWNKLELALAESCNLACKYCYCSTCRDMPNQGIMKETVARQAITWLFAVSGRSKDVHITFFGGEPLLNKPVLFFAVRYSQRLGKLHGKKVSYSMTTNGTLLDDKVSKVIKRYNFGLMVSLDGPRDLHNAQCPTRDGRGSFEAAAAGIKTLMARRRSVTVRCTMAHPAPRMLDLIRFFEDFGFTRIVLGRTVSPIKTSPVDFTDEDFASCDQQEREELIPWMLRTLAAGQTPKYYPYGEFVSRHLDDTVAPKVSPFRCGACRGTMTVGADGTLYPCHRFVGVEAWRIGTVETGPDYDRCKQFWRDYHACTASHCQSCWMWAECRGPCPWEIARADGSFQMNGRTCQHVQQFFERATLLLSRRRKQMGAGTMQPQSH